MKRRTKIIVWAATLAGLVIAGPLLFRALRREPPKKLLRDARRALQVGEFDRAEQIAVQIPPGSREYSDALLIAGEAATRQKRYPQAIAHYGGIPPDSSDQSVTGMYCIGDLLMQMGNAFEAERQYRRVLAVRPSDPWTLEQLAATLTTFGRRWEAMPYLFALAQMQRISVEQLLLLGETDVGLAQPADLSKFHGRAADDALLLIARARYAYDAQDPATAERFARQAIDTAPEQIEAWALLGRSLLYRPNLESEFLEWHAHVPKAAESHPDVWLARGIWAQEHGELEVAVRCFWETLRRHPDSQSANYHLGQTLLKVDPSQTGQAAPFLNRAQLLEKLSRELILIFREKTSLAHVRPAAELTESLGRLWEARAWCLRALELKPDLDWALRQLQRLNARLRPDTPRVLLAAKPAESNDFSSFPLPKWKAIGGNRPAFATTGRADAATVRFEDCAAAAGITFLYFNGADPPTDGKLIYQLLGGGVAVIDFDGDLWPDLYFAQGAPAPDDAEQHGYRDRLYRNLGDGRFDDVTHEAGLGDGRHTLGVSAGDIDNDGFPDLYLANAGTNRLYRNNGDGTFADATTHSGISGQHCTASCLIADLNGDACPELFDVNYVAEPEVYSLVCHKNGRAVSCDPRLFTGDPDRLYLSLGDGHFAEITDECGIRVPEGKGLGVVAADFSGSGFLNLFVANDGTGNFYFLNETPRRGERPVFREAALSAGVAYSEDGRVQASMGVAIDDADGDGLLDLYVTNFYNESSAFYHQTAVNVFEDAKRRFGLREPTLFLLGFGTQFIDGDLDGYPDLIATNGGIEDYSDEGKPYRMPPQYFRNVSGKAFEEATSDSLGPFFGRKYLGRGLARVDWNRDGKEDIVISHLDSPAALLKNSTAKAGHFFALRLTGTDSSRDAIGATVRCEAGGRVRVRQLTAGDGYMASNERQLIIGLGDAELVDQLTIRWPSGRQETHVKVAADRHWLAVEGRRSLYELPRLLPTDSQ